MDFLFHYRSIKAKKIGISRAFGMKIDKDSVASIKVHPGLLLVASVLLGWGAETVVPIGLGLEGMPAVKNAGLVILALGLLFWFSAYWALLRAGTHINPSKPTTQIVSTGVYALSRNPVYLGVCLAGIGLGLAKNSLSIVLCAILLAWLFYWAVVLAEEAYLERRFGEEYVQYKNRVRRWL